MTRENFCPRVEEMRAEPRRATYLDHAPVDRWMELIITPVPVPTAFGGEAKQVGALSAGERSI
jgi:hypothetical protein